MTAAPSPSKKRSLLRKFLYLAAAAVLLGSLLLSYMQWEANTLRFRETQAPAGMPARPFRPAHPGPVGRAHGASPCWKRRCTWRSRPNRT